MWVEDASNSGGFTTPYKFTGKELDKETNLYYFGARYYDARISRWISTDPALQEGKYFPKPNDYETEHDFYWYILNDASGKLPGMGGVYNNLNLNLYHYVKLNPIIYIDHDGRLVGIDDVFGWAIKRLFEFRNDNFISGVTQNLKESWSLIGGIFNTFHGGDSVGGFLKGLGELGLRLTGNLPNELMGLIVGYGFVQVGGAITEMSDDVQLVSIEGVDWAFTLGSKVIGSSFKTDLKMRLHEEGHYYQSLILGPLFVPIIGIPSVGHYFYSAPKIRSGIMPYEDYYKFYTKSIANKLAGITF